MHETIYCPQFLTHTEFDWIRNVTPVDSPEKADIIVFSGGADINPALYNCERHHSTYYSERRDALEVGCFNSLSKNQTVIGICRGAQLVTALNGGKDGLDFYRCIADKWVSKVKKGGYIALECGENQSAQITDLFKDKYSEKQVIYDFNDIDRIVTFGI